jgi:hypothetical protein
MFAPLRGRRPKRKPPPERACMTPGCGVAIASWKWLCDGCFGQLPYDRKREICAARQARESSRVFGLSRAAAEWLASQRIKAVGEG